MKALSAVLLTAGIATILNGNVTQNVTYSQSLYPTCGIVTSVTETELEFTDVSGNVWTTFDPQDYEIGDRIAAIMDNNGTPIIYDDIVVSTKYCGWVY